MRQDQLMLWMKQWRCLEWDSSLPAHNNLGSTADSQTEPESSQSASQSASRRGIRGWKQASQSVCHLACRWHINLDLHFNSPSSLPDSLSWRLSGLCVYARCSPSAAKRRTQVVPSLSLFAGLWRSAPQPMAWNFALGTKYPPCDALPQGFGHTEACH